MDDLKLTLIIIVIAGILATFVLFIYLKNRRSKDDELDKYCLHMGYSCDRTKKPSQSTLTVRGDDFLLESWMRSLRNPAGDDVTWELVTRWTSDIADSGRPAFAIGSMPVNENWDKLPDMVKYMAVQKLMDESGLTLDPKSVQIVEAGGKSAFLLFEESPGASYAAVQRLRPLLSQWSNKQIILIKSSPDGAEVRIHRCYIRNVELLKKVLDLAEAVSP